MSEYELVKVDSTTIRRVKVAKPAPKVDEPKADEPKPKAEKQKKAEK